MRPTRIRDKKMGCPLKGYCSAFENCPIGPEKYNLARNYCNTSVDWKDCPALDPNEYHKRVKSIPSRKIILLNLFLGWLGVHRFYVGKPMSGILYALSLGFVGVGVAVDMVLIALGKFDYKVETATKGEKQLCWIVVGLIILMFIILSGS